MGFACEELGNQGRDSSGKITPSWGLVCMVEKPDNEGRFAWIRNPSKQRSIFQHSLVVITPLAILASIALTLGFIFAGDNSGARVRMIEASLAVIGGAGAAVALVVNYRRQQVLEEQNQRDYRENLTKHFSDFTNELADDKPPLKLAGVYSLFRLADEWKEQRQQIIDVFCSYLRLPWPDKESLILIPGEERRTKINPEWTTEHTVRQTILREMVKRMQKDGTFMEAAYTYDFTGATFYGDAYFIRAIFSGDADFTGATFSGDAYFMGATFARVSLFVKTTFSGDARFGAIDVIGGPDSDGGPATFSGDAYFMDCMFEKKAQFWKTTFLGKVYAFRAIFNERANFTNVTFDQSLEMNLAKFKDGVDFHRADFHGDVEFIDTKFETGGKSVWRAAMFDDAKFRSTSTFDGAIFAGVSFCGVRFFSGADFTRASLAEATFADADLNGYVDFTNSRFTGATSFTSATLNVDVKFNPASFEASVDLQDISFSDDCGWPTGIPNPPPPNITISIRKKA